MLNPSGGLSDEVTPDVNLPMVTERTYNVLSVPQIAFEQLVRHELDLDDNSTENRHLIGFSGNDTVMIQYMHPSANSREWKFSTDGHIYTRLRRDWVNWNDWVMLC